MSVQALSDLGESEGDAAGNEMQRSLVWRAGFPVRSQTFSLLGSLRLCGSQATRIYGVGVVIVLAARGVISTS